MVFENLVVYLLDKYLGDYIENLDTKKLKIGLWNGDVVLENLYLKPNALADLKLPVTISIGFLQKLSLQVPWKNLYTHPTKATIDGLYLLVVPKTEVEYDAQRDEKEKHEAKMKEVQNIEELRKLKEAEKSGTTDNKNDTFVERMQLQVIRNLELSIRNIHIVYEDKSTKPDHPFALGITLNYITLHTTTSDWKQTILKEDTPLIHKLGELSAFSIYWNTNAQSRSGLSRDEIVKNLQGKIAVNNQNAPPDISYILRPLNIKAKIILVMKPREQQFKQPMFDIKVDLEEISLNINNAQYSDLLDLLELQDYLTVQSKFIKYKKIDKTQKQSIKNWKFAYDAIVNEEIRPRFDCYKWENIKAHLNRCREYRTLHIQSLTGKITNEEKQRAQELEKKLDVFNLTYIRRSAELEAKKKKDQEPKSWWGSVSSWWGGTTPQDEPEMDLEKVMSPDEKKKLYDAIGYEGDDTSTSTYPTEFVDIDLAIRLNMVDVNVWSKINSNDTQFRIVARAVVPDTSLAFKRRPATDAIAVFVALGSFQVFGISTDSKYLELSNTNRPVLAQPINRDLTKSTNEKLLKIEFETNPIDKSCDYRVKLVSQPLEIKYNAPTINKLVECFQQDTQRNLQGVKQVAYSTYTDVKHRSYILMKHNIEKIKVLDIDIDIQSTYFLLPTNGIYQEGAAAICMDFGHLTVKRRTNDDQEKSVVSKEAKDIEEARELSYTQFKLRLEDVQLIYANQNESWEKACRDKNTRLHIIKPMELDLDLGKCIYSDDAVLPAWKVAGNIPNVNVHLSDKRLFQIINHIQTVPFPESTTSAIAAPSAETEIAPTPSLLNQAEQTLETVEGMTPVLKTKEKVEAEEGIEKIVKEEKKNQFEGQLTQLEATFSLEKIDLHIDESTGENSEDEPFLRLTLDSIIAITKIKTFDMEFDASLTNFIVYHEQFIGKDQQNLRLLSAQLDKINENNNQKLVSVNFLHTSKENPLFSSSTYNGIENQANVHFSKLVVTLQLEALLSILKFQDSLMKKLPSDTTEEQARKKQEEKTSKIVKKNDLPATPSLTILADLEEFRIILASKQAQIFDIQVQGVKADVSQASEKTLVSLILSDLRVCDPYKNARYRKIISQKGDDKDLLRVDLSLFNYPEGFEKGIDVFDCDVSVEFAKANIVFLFKHIDALLSFLDSLNITKAALTLATTQADAAYEQVQKLQEQAFKVHLDVTFNAPNIIIPTNSYSDEALSLDLGKLTLKTSFYDDPKRSLVEQQSVVLENVLASRVKLDQDYNILGEAILLECAELNTTINRLLFPQRAKTEPAVSIKAEWDLVHFQLAKHDYSCVMKVLMENFSENIRNQMPESLQNEQFHYRQEEQEKEEDELRDAVIKKQKESQTDEILQTLKFRARIKKVALTLYLGDSDLTTRENKRNENLKLANVEIEMLEALFRQQSTGSYKAIARVKNFLLDDLRETNKPDSVTRMMDRHFTVDPDTQMLIASFEFQPKNSSNPMALRKLNAQLESLYICISLDYLMTLQDFFISGLPSANTDENKQEIDQKSIPKPEPSDSEKTRTKVDPKPPTKPPTSSTPEEVETRMEISVKNPEVILLEDQHNAHSNCLVLDLALQLRMKTINNRTELYGWLKDLTVYSSNFAELRDSKNSGSTVKYRILQPANIDVFLTMSNEEQKIDLRISDIMISIAPAAIRIVIGVTSSLGTLQATAKDENEKSTTKTLFSPKSIADANFWFTKELNQNNLTTEQTIVKKEENKVNESEIAQKPMLQQLILTLDAIEIKLEVGLGSITKSVVAMCLTNLTADVQNWSSNLSLASTINVEAALYNENMSAWESLIEPAMNSNGSRFSPWCITCSIIPSLASYVKDDEEGQKNVQSSIAKQTIIVRADQLLNITITKTGLDLIQRLSALFNDVYNKRLPPSDDDDLPLLSLSNKTGRDLLIENLLGLQFTKGQQSDSITLRNDETIPLDISTDHQTVGRLSVTDEQNLTRPQEFTVRTEEGPKTIRIGRTLKRAYSLGPSLNAKFPIELLCDVQVENDRRQIILSSIVRIVNNTTMSLFVLNVDPIHPKKHSVIGKIPINETYHVPIDSLYKYSNLPIFFSIDGESDDSDFFSFDWESEYTMERKLRTKDGTDAHFIIFKEVSSPYFENTDRSAHGAFTIYVQPAIHITNLLPIDAQCSIDNAETFDLKPSQLQLIPTANKSSKFVFTIPSYNNSKWISEPIDYNAEGRGDHNEYPVVFHTETNNQEILRMVLRVDTYHESYRIVLYSPLWILNRSNLKLEFQIDTDRTIIDTIETPYFICPEKYDTDAGKKGQIRITNLESTEATTNWSEKFSLDVIKSTGMTTCKAANGRSYMICVDIGTSSFGTTKLVTLLPSMLVINNSSISIDFVETVANKEQDQWQTIAPTNLIPFWPHNVKDGLMSVRYSHNNVTSNPFQMMQKHRTLLRMEDEENPGINVEVTKTEFDGVKVIFTDYKIGDASVLIVNCLKDQPISFCQRDDKRTQILPELNYIYYTWIDPIKPRELIVSCGSKSATIKLNVECGSFGKDGDRNVTYAIFIDGIQTVLLFSDDTKIIEAASGISSLASAMNQRIQIGIHDIGLSIVNDSTTEELLYISLNKSNVIWTATKKTRVKALPRNLNDQLEELYRTHIEQCETNPDNKQLVKKTYQSSDLKEILFIEETAEIVNNRGQRKVVKRQALDGLSIVYAWSTSEYALHVRINRLQIDNQLEGAIFPVVLHPVMPKGAEHDIAEKPFIELSVLETKAEKSDIMQFKYFKVLIQEFAVRIDQGLIVAFIEFYRPRNTDTAPTINMTTDLEQIQKSLDVIIKSQITSGPATSSEMFFDIIHLSPLKIHLSFSMHGSKPSNELLAGFPLVGFLLRTLNVAEVQDVILRLGFYERNYEKFTTAKITSEVSSHYLNQFLKQIHVLVFGLDVLGNPFGVIRGLAEGVESFFYEPYKGAIEGPLEFAEGVATGVRTLFGSTVGGAAGAVSKITGVLGKGLATLTFDEEYKASRIRRKDPGGNAATHIATGGKNVVMGFVDGVKGVVEKPVQGAKKDGASGFFKGLGKGFIGLVARPTGGIIDFTSSSLDLVKRMAQQEDVIRRVRYPRHIRHDHLVRPYIAHEAMGFYILNRLEGENRNENETYVGHITCLENPPSLLMATSERILFITEISFLGIYEADWQFEYKDLKEKPTIKIDSHQIQFLTKEPTKIGTLKSQQTYGKLVKYQSPADAKYITNKIAIAMQNAGFQTSSNDA